MRRRNTILRGLYPLWRSWSILSTITLEGVYSGQRLSTFHVGYGSVVVSACQYVHLPLISRAQPQLAPRSSAVLALHVSLFELARSLNGTTSAIVDLQTSFVSCRTAFALPPPREPPWEQPIAMLLPTQTTGRRSKTKGSVAECRTATPSVTTVSKRCPVLRTPTETCAGKKLKDRLKKAEEIISSYDMTDPPLSNSSVKAETTDLCRDQDNPPRDKSNASAQQQYTEVPANIPLPATYSLFSPSGGITESMAQNIDSFFHPFYSWNAAATGPTGATTSLTINYERYIDNGSSPFDEGYRAMSGTCVAQQ